MRIALFSGNYNYLREGANQALNQLVRYLEAERGHIVRIYSPVGKAAAFEPAGTLVPVPSITLPIRTEFRLALGIPRAIRRDVRAFAPDLIHVSTPDILDTRAQSLAKRLGVPIVASLHTHFETYLEHYGMGWARPLVEAHLRRFYRRGDHVLAPTSSLVESMKMLRGDDHASLWSRGVDRALFNPGKRDEGWRRALGVAHDEIIVLFFGRLVLEKGVRTFARVFRALLNQGWNVRPLIVGAGPAVGELRDLPGVILAGHLEGGPLARAIASADIMLTPSTSETFGNVVLEAMASGVPVVSADAPSARALLIDGVTGLLCSPRETTAYVDRMRGLLRAGDARARMGAAARQASRAFSWTHASHSVLNAYREVLRRA